MIKKCVMCGEGFHPNGNNKTCSKECSMKCSMIRNAQYNKQYRKHYHKKRYYKKKKKIIIKCVVCGILFDGIKNYSIYCSKKCSNLAMIKIKSKWYNENKKKINNRQSEYSIKNGIMFRGVYYNINTINNPVLKKGIQGLISLRDYKRARRSKNKTGGMIE